jgi:hypothetical protein
VQAFEDQKTQFELNSLSDLQHVEFVAEDRSDVIILANSSDKTSRRVDDRLETMSRVFALVDLRTRRCSSQCEIK